LPNTYYLTTVQQLNTKESPSMTTKAKYLLIFFLWIGISNHLLAQGWYSSLWGYRKTITIDFNKVPNTDQSNFPVLVYLTSDAGLSSHAQSTGNDILFTSNNGTTKIPYERELYTSGTGALVAWVQVPTVSHTANTIIYMYYGNSLASDQQQATSAWDANYKGVWHLKEATGSNSADATSSGFTLTPVNSPTQSTSQINGGLNYNGSTQYTSRTTNATSVTSNWTLEAWMNPGSLSQLGLAVYNGNDAGGFGFGVGNGAGAAGGNLTGLFGGVVWINSSYTFASTGTWYHVVMKRSSGGTTTFYVNGTVTSGSSGSAPIAPNARFTVGNQLDGANNPYRYFNGLVDEVRISITERTADWIKTEYNNQSSPSTFYAIGTETSSPVYVWNHSISTDWQIAANWTPARTTPQTWDVLQFNGGGNVTVTNVPTQTIGQLLLSSSSTVNLQPAAASNTLTITDVLSTAAGDILNFGSGVILGGTLTTLTNAGKIQTAVLTATSATPVPTGKSWGGTFEYNGSGAQTAVTGTYTTLKINNSTGVTLGGTLTVTNLTIGDVTANSIFSDGAFQITGNAAGACTMGTGSRLNIGLTSSATITAFPTNFSAPNISLDASSTLAYQANAAQTISNLPTYGNVILNTGAAATVKTAVGALTLNGSLTISANTTFAGGTSLTHNIGGDWTNNGSFSFTTTSTININGNNASNINGTATTTFNNLTVNKGAAATTVTSTSKAFTTSNNLTVTQGNLILQATDVSYVVTNDLVIATNGTLTHSVLWTGPSYVLLSVGGNISVDGIFTYTVRSHVQMTSSATKTIRSGSNAPSSFSILTFTNGGTFNASGTLRVDDNFWVMIGGSGGSFHTNGNNVTANGALLNGIGTLYVDGGNLSVSGGGINIGSAVGNGAMVFSSGSVTTDALFVGNGTQTGTLSQTGGTMNITGNIIIYPSCSYTCTNSPVINVAGNWTKNGTYTKATETVCFNGTTAAQTIGGTSGTTFANLTINNTYAPSPIVSIATAPTVTGILTLTAGRLVLGSNTLILSTNTPIAGSPFSTANMIQADGTGFIAKSITATGSYDYPIGSNTNNLAYSPATVNFTAGAPFTSAFLNINLKDVVEPHVTKSNFIRRYWILSTTGTFTSPSYTATFTYADGDVNIPLSEANLVAAKYTGSMAYFSNAVNTGLNTLSFPAASTFGNYTAEGNLGLIISASPNPTCAGPTILLTATASSGSLPYTYSWSTLATTSSTSVIPLSTTTYTVTVTDNLSGQAISSITETIYPVPTYSLASTNVSCYAGNDGMITVTVAGGTGPYQYSSDNGTTWLPASPTGDSYTFTNMVANVPYRIRVKDSNGCTSPTVP
jgi:hypothetical protein